MGRKTIVTLRKSLSSSGSEDEQSLTSRSIVNSNTLVNRTFGGKVSCNVSRKPSSFTMIGVDINRSQSCEMEHVDNELVEGDSNISVIENKALKVDYGQREIKLSKRTTEVDKQKDDDRPKDLPPQTYVDDQIMKKMMSRTYRLSRKQRLDKFVSNPLKSTKLAVSGKRSQEKLSKFNGVASNDEENRSVPLIPKKCVLLKSRIKSIKRSPTKGNSPDRKRHQSDSVSKELKV